MMIMENIPNTWGSLMRERAEKNNCWERERNIPSKVDCVIVTTAHNEFKEMQLEDLARMISQFL